MPKNVVVTGASRGIGLELCRVYKNRGDNVFALCKVATDELEQLNVRILTGVDVSRDDDVSRMANDLASIPIDILINNAGVFPMGDFDDEDLNFDDMMKSFDVNAVGPLRVTWALRDNLRNGSKLAMITSRMGSIEDNESGEFYAYRMSKTALNALTKTLAVDLADRGVVVVALHPGFVRTAMTGFRGSTSPEAAAFALAQRIDEVDMQYTGSFIHAQGEFLPW
eukprot:Rmarinus@m.22207